MKHVLVLVGPKGAGKSTLGRILDAELGVHFVVVEPLFLALREALGAGHPDLERRGFEAVRDAVWAALDRYDAVGFETTGASAQVPGLLADLASRAEVHPVRVLATPEQCLARFAARDAAGHLPVPLEQVGRINALAAQVELPWAAEVDNRGPLDASELVAAVKRWIGRPGSSGKVGPQTP